MQNESTYVIFLSGISCSGKTTIGQIIASNYTLDDNDRRPFYFIDQDWYFHKNKPKINLSNGSVLNNWDHKDSIDHKSLNRKIIKVKKEGKHVIVAGFALRDGWFQGEAMPDIHIHIKIPKRLSLETRLKIKPGGNKKDKVLLFEEAVWPFYQETLEQSIFDCVIDGVVDEDSVVFERIPLQKMVEHVMNKMRETLVK